MSVFNGSRKEICGKWSRLLLFETMRYIAIRSDTMQAEKIALFPIRNCPVGSNCIRRSMKGSVKFKLALPFSAGVSIYKMLQECRNTHTFLRCGKVVVFVFSLHFNKLSCVYSYLLRTMSNRQKKLPNNFSFFSFVDVT